MNPARWLLDRTRPAIAAWWASNRRKVADIVERASWTAVQLTLGLVSVDALDLPPGWAVPVGAGLAVVKGWVAQRLGHKGSASTLPASLDPKGP